MTLIVFFCSGKSQKRFREATKKIIDNLFASYDKRIRPNGANETDYESRYKMFAKH